MHLCLSTEINIPWNDSDNTFCTMMIQAVYHPQPPCPFPATQTNYLPAFKTCINQHSIHHHDPPSSTQSSRGYKHTPTPTIPPPQPNPLCTAVPPACNIIDHQTILPCSHHNHHWSNQMSLPKPWNVLIVISCNVNSLSTQLDYIQWKAAAQAIHEINANSVSLQETNVAWTKIHQHRIQQILHNTTGFASISTTISSEIPAQPLQWGRTLQALVGDWASRTITHGQDKSGVGRWSYLKLQGKDDQQFIILSGYHVGNSQKLNFRSNNTYNQQYWLLH